MVHARKTLRVCIESAMRAIKPIACIQLYCSRHRIMKISLNQAHAPNSHNISHPHYLLLLSNNNVNIIF